MTLPTRDTVRAGSISSSSPTTSCFSPLSVSPSSLESGILSPDTLEYGTAKSSPVSVSKVMPYSTSHFLAHGACASCHISPPGGTTAASSGSVRPSLNLILKLIVSCRLPTLADDSRTQALLSHAGVLLVSAADRPRLSSREAPERLQGTCCTSPRHSMAHWVGPGFYVHSYWSNYITVSRWSYGINLTLIGNAVYTSMDVPDFFLAIVKVFNYLHLDGIQNPTFVVFIGFWT